MVKHHERKNAIFTGSRPVIDKCLRRKKRKLRGLQDVAGASQVQKRGRGGGRGWHRPKGEGLETGYV